MQQVAIGSIMKHQEVSESFRNLQEGSGIIRKAPHQNLNNKQTKYSGSEATSRL